MEFHAISLAKVPEDQELVDLKPEQRIFESKIEALKSMKKWKQCNPRLNSFNNFQDACNCVKTMAFLEDNNVEISVTAATPSEGCPFNGLIPQELKQMKLAINADDEDKVRLLVQTNPR
jgi:hypothetical protein